ncbi:MAG: cytochrome c [Deltaproteobacteria bacterium]|nr:MAG: cytochrome c [Deltaproteobacteria bacterium]
MDWGPDGRRGPLPALPRGMRSKVCDRWRWRVRLGAALLPLALVGCDLGGGGGGGPSPVPRPPLPAYAPPRAPADPVARGRALFEARGCRLCHGEAGAGGVANPGSDTGGKINGLTLVKEGYTPEQLAKKIAEGVPFVGKATPDGPTPPLRMPPYGEQLSRAEIDDLVAYLISLYPKDREVDDDWDD